MLNWKHWFLIAGFGAIATGGIWLMGCGPSSGVASAQAQTAGPTVNVQITTPERRDVSRLLSLPGDTVPIEQATLYAKAPGTLGRITVDKGDRVHAGQILAEIQAPELAADREQAQQTYQSTLAAVRGQQANLARSVAETDRARSLAEKAQADIVQSKADQNRTQALFQQSQGAMQQAREQQTQAEANREEAQAQLRRAQADLEAAQAEQKFAELTYTRYKGIYDKDKRLIAGQDVDAAETKAVAARSRTEAARQQIAAAQGRLKAVQAQINAAKSQVEQEQAQVVAAQEQVHVAEAKTQSLQKQSEVAQKEIEISRRQQDTADAKAQEIRYQAKAGQSAVRKLETLADYRTIRAPFDGIVIQRHADPGAFIQTASASQNAAAIVTVARMDTVRLRFYIPESETRFVRVGTAVKITLASQPDTALTGRVARTAAALDPKTHTLLTEVELPNKSGQLLTGTYATVKVVLETHPGVISLPSQAVGSEKAGKFVFVVEQGKAKRVGVKVGFDDGTYTEIQEGLHGGEQVVVTGRDALSPNMSVQTAPWTPTPKK